MDQIKIGRFIAERRKKKNLTQMQLAEIVNVTDRAVSKWETGRSLPDSSIMLELCSALEITVTDLLNGEVIMENNDKKNEQILLEMAKEGEEKNKIIWITMWIIIGVSFVGLLAGSLLVAWFIPEGTWQNLAMFGVGLAFLPPCFFALKLEIGVGAYKCKHCGHEIVPTYTQALKAMHMGTTRYLKCPKCNQRSWCKKVIKK